MDHHNTLKKYQIAYHVYIRWYKQAGCFETWKKRNKYGEPEAIFFYKFFEATYFVKYIKGVFNKGLFIGVPKVWQAWHVPWEPLEGGATEQFLLKSDKPSSNRFVDGFFATFLKTVIPSGV